MTAALVGLIGVVVGGGLTFASSYLLQRRSERRGANIALAIVGSELEEATGALAMIGAETQGANWPMAGWEHLDWTGSWRTRRAELATAIPSTEFRALARAYVLMAQLQNGLQAGERPVSGTDREFLGRVKEGLAEAPKVSRL